MVKSIVSYPQTDAVDDSQPDKQSQQIRTAIAKKRQPDSDYRQKAKIHPQINENVQKNNGKVSQTKKPDEVI